MYYYKLLSTRLLYNFTNIAFEKKIINNLRDNSNVIYRKIVMMIEDIENSISEKELYTQLTVKITSSNYPNINETDINRNIINAKFLRYYAWDDIFTDFNDINYKLPLVLQPLVDIYNKYDKIRFPDRIFKWAYQYGYGILNKSKRPQCIIFIQ